MGANAIYAGDPVSTGGRNPFNYEKVEEISRDVSTNWLTADDITNHLNLFDDTSQDTYVLGLEIAARQAIEDYLGISIFATSYRVWYGASLMFGTPVALDLPEISQNSTPSLSGVTVTKVAYWDQSSPPVLVSLASGDYYYDASGNRVIVSNIPDSINQNIANPIIVEYSTTASPLAGYPVIKQAGLLMLTHLYNQRSESVEKGVSTIPYGVDALLRKYKPLVM